MVEKQTRRRGAVLDDAILDAAWLELRQGGWSEFTIAGVAARSGAAKTVIYRRYRDRVELAEQMLARAALSQERPVPGRHDLRADLISFLDGMCTFLEGPFGAAVRGVLVERGAIEQRSIFAGKPVVAEVDDIVAAAVDRGQLPERPSALAINLGHAVVMSEFFHVGKPPNRAAVVELVDTLWLPALGFLTSRTPPVQ